MNKADFKPSLIRQTSCEVYEHLQTPAKIQMKRRYLYATEQASRHWFTVSMMAIRFPPDMPVQSMRRGDNVILIKPAEG